jgi:hypothetical protein
VANTGTINLTGDVTGPLTGSKSITATWSLAAAVADVQTVSLSSGDNTITVPTGTSFILFTPPVANAEVLKVKGNAADTGVQISKVLPTVLTWDATGSLIINAGGAVAGCEITFA